MKPLSLSAFERKIRVNFKNKDLLHQVFIHRSYLNEHPNFELDSNERLEFLGDAALELIVTEYLFENFPNPEGELTNWRAALVKGSTLAEIAKKLEMGKYLYLSKGEIKTGGRERELILANCFEALIGAIYLDQGYSAAKNFVKKHLLSRLNQILKRKLYIEPKSKLQEITQDSFKIIPEYKVLTEKGPDHAKIFIVGVFINGKLYGKGRGSSKQIAEQIAASKALKKLENNQKPVK